MHNDSSIQTQVALSLLPKINSRLYLPLIKKCGGIEGYFHENEKTLTALYTDFHLKTERLNRQTALQEAEKEMEKMGKNNIRICSVEHHTYPYLLHQCEDTPLVFFYKGQLISDDHKFLAIVGTRRASEHCKRRVERILQEIADTTYTPIIVSGLAFGIDRCAHEASLKNHLPTYAILGHGLHTIYPASHKHLAEKIIAQGGALISEFPCSSRILPINFLQRNRIIAGLCQATLIAESAEKGGAMATARMAFSYNREVIALPGRPEDKMSAGCNLLIKKNIASLAENGEDAIAALGWIPEKQLPVQTSLSFTDLNEPQTRILEQLKENGSMTINELSVATRMPVSELSVQLLTLELEGILLSLPGKTYIIN